MLTDKNVPVTGGAGSTVNLFFVRTPLQYFISRHIARNVDPGAQNFLFDIAPPHAPGIANMPPEKCWVFSGKYYHSLPRRGFKRWEKTINHLQWVEQKLEHNFTHLRIHITSIDNSVWNFLIHYLQYRFPCANICVRLLNDGAYNLIRHPISLLMRFRHWQRKLRRLYARELNFYCYSGDSTGADADIVDRIYWFEGIPSEYPHEKVYPLNFNTENLKVKWHQGKALVLGNPAWGKLRQGMLEWTLETVANTKLIYKPHPAENTQCLPDKLCIAEFKESLEEHLMENRYSLIAGIASTGLLTARLICGPNARIVSYGMNRVREMDSECEIDTNISWLDAAARAYTKIGIEFVDA